MVRSKETENVKVVEPITEAENKQSIDELAYEVKFKKHPVYKRKELERKLVNEILKATNLGAFAQRENFEKNCFHEFKGYGKYENGVINECYQYAFSDYGKKDEETGERIPFMQLYNKAFGDFKKYILKKEKIIETNGMNNDATKHFIRTYINQLLDSKGLDHVKKSDNLNLFKIDKIKEFLEAKGFGEEEFNEAERILHQNYVYPDVSKGDNGEYVENALSDGISDDVCIHNENIMLQIADKLKESFDKADNPSMISNLKCYVTIKALNYCSTYGSLSDIYLEDYIDPKLGKYILQRPNEPDMVKLVGEYLNVSRETARRRLHKAELHLMS